MRIKGQQRIAELFGVTRETIDNWQQQGFPVAVRGGPGVPSEFETEACIKWMIDREIGKVRADRPQDRLARAQADKIEMENTERRKLLIPVGQIEPRLAAAFTAARGLWGGVLQRLPPELPADIGAREEMLRAEFEAFLHSFADLASGGLDVDEA